jgi:hypothetical protein
LLIGLPPCRPFLSSQARRREPYGHAAAHHPAKIVFAFVLYITRDCISDRTGSVSFKLTVRDADVASLRLRHALRLRW